MLGAVQRAGGKPVKKRREGRIHVAGQSAGAHEPYPNVSTYCRGYLLDEHAAAEHVPGCPLTIPSAGRGSKVLRTPGCFEEHQRRVREENKK